MVLEIDAFGWASLALGFAAAVIVSLASFLTYLFSFFAVLVHEMGHALAGWLFGYPSIPSFDFFYGGGVTIHQGRIIAISVLVYAAIGVGAFLFRRNMIMLALAALVAMVYTVLAFTSVHQVLIIALGHGTELIIAAVFLYRAISGRSLIQKAERPVYAFVGFFLVIYNVAFDYRLITDTGFRFEYEYAKGGMEMDFTRLAYEYLHTELVTVAEVFLVLSLCVPFASLGFHLVRRHAPGLFSEE